MVKFFSYIFIGVVVLSSCHTEVPDESKSEAVFYVRGEINGNKVNLNAGDDDYYMLPFFNDDTLGIRSFVGRLGHYNCVGDVNCPQSVEIFIREKESTSSSKERIEETVFPRVCDLRGPAIYWFDSYKASFVSKSLPVGLSHDWYFGDGNSSTDVNPVHYYVNKADSIVSPSLVVNNFSTGCQSSISYPVDFVSPCNVDFFPEVQGAVVILHPSPAPTAGRVQLWSYDGDAYAPYSSKGPPTGPVNLVCLVSTEIATNCVSNKCKNVVTDTAAMNCVANFDVVKEIVTIKDVKDFMEVTVKWQNDAGVVYQSDLFAQPNGFSFEILEVTDYKDSKDGDATKMVSIKFNLRLFGTSETDFVDFNSEKSVIAVAYPKI